MHKNMVDTKCSTYDIEFISHFTFSSVGIPKPKECTEWSSREQNNVKSFVLAAKGNQNVEQLLREGRSTVRIAYFQSSFFAGERRCERTDVRQKDLRKFVETYSNMISSTTIKGAILG